MTYIMRNILILTQPDDTHAIYVKLALERKGHRAILCYTGDFPENQTHAFKYDKDFISWDSEGIHDYISRINIDVVWNRRLGKPLLPDYLHELDVDNAMKENYIFFHSLWQTVLQDAVWINKIDKQRRANHKSYQLKLASELGFNIPKTLISNSPARIKSFIGSFASGDVIYKTLLPLSWFDDDNIAMTYTKGISQKQLPVDRILQSVPGIFQEKIQKKHELRITYFGGKYIAVKIESQVHPKGKDDWRQAPTRELALSQIDLPVEIDNKCQLLMQKLGLKFGCLDFIVTPDNDYYFLEINEQGQFLWQERVNPEIKVLDAFANFLVSKGGQIRQLEKNYVTRMSDFDHEVELYVDVATRMHKGTVLDGRL